MIPASTPVSIMALFLLSAGEQTHGSPGVQSGEGVPLVEVRRIEPAGGHTELSPMPTARRWSRELLPTEAALRMDSTS